MIVLHYPKLNWHDMQHSITVCPSHPSSIVNGQHLTATFYETEI
jgi:hypothetical protein